MNLYNKISKLLSRAIFIGAIIVHYPLLAGDQFCQSNQLGWHFYCDNDEKEIENNQPQNSKEALDKLSAIKQQITESKALAVLHPSAENVENYIRLQRQQLDMASSFADQWQRVLWQKPEIDYNFTRPVASIAKRIWLDKRKNEENDNLAKLAKRYGIFYIYRSDCMFCRGYTPILKSFAQAHNITVKAIAQDGIIIPQWPDSLINRGQINTLGLDNYPVPATLLFDNKTKNITPIGFGLLSEQELKERIYLLLNKEVGSDY